MLAFPLGRYYNPTQTGALPPFFKSKRDVGESMAYHDYDWEFRRGPIRWRVAEMVARIYIGWGWALLTFWLITELLGPESEYWPMVAFGVLMFWGFDLALPERRYDD